MAKKEKKFNIYTELKKELKPHKPSEDTNFYEAMGFVEPKYRDSRKKDKSKKK